MGNSNKAYMPRPLRERKKPDPHAPRFFKRAHKLASNEFCNKLISENKELLKGYTPAKIRALIRDFHKEHVAKYVLNERGPLVLPYMLGHMFLGVFGKWYKGVDYVKSAELGLEVHHRNNHSDGYGAAWYYSTSMVRCDSIISRGMWGFKEVSCPKVKKSIKEAMENKWKEFIYIKNNKFVEGALRSAMGKQMNHKIHGKAIEEYNEFSFE